MKTTLTIKITLADDEWDRLERQFFGSSLATVGILETVLEDALIGNLGIISGVKLTKIE